MNSSHRSQPAPTKEMTQAAVEWLLEQQEGFSAARAAQFQAWREADPRHEVAITKAERTMALLGGMPQLKEAISDRFAAEMAEVPRPRRRFWQLAGWTAAAAAIVLTAVGVARWPGADGRRTESSYVSNPDRPQQLVLEDGSFVNLNTNTAIRTQMRPRERRIALQEGEAHFAVAHDAARPFIVEAAGVMIRAVGTAFNVRVSQNRVEVLVLEGKVEVSDARGGGMLAQRPQLGVSERAIVSRTSAAPAVQLDKANSSEVRAAVSWHSAVTTISSRPLREIVELFNRRNTLRLTIADAELAERNLGGTFALNQPKAFVRALEFDGDVVAEARGEAEIVLRLKR